MCVFCPAFHKMARNAGAAGFTYGDVRRVRAKTVQAWRQHD